MCYNASKPVISQGNEAAWHDKNHVRVAGAQSVFESAFIYVVLKVNAFRKYWNIKIFLK